jgi:cyclopropane-fatty-acyl-phospholipid synthase
LHGGRLTVTDVDGTTEGFGPADAELTAEIVVRDPRCWSAIVTEGSIGFGRGFIEGWWHSEDPVTAVRILIANMHALDDVQRRIVGVTHPVLDPIRRVRGPRDRRGNREDISAHYDIGNDFFSLFLDETLSYSSATFASADTSLRDASLAKYDRLLDKLDIGSTDHVLEIGTGWGGFAIRAAGTRACDVTTTTISVEQRREATRRVAEAELSDKVTLLDSDWRDLEGTHDKIVSIEMIEAVDWRDYESFFAKIERCLAPDGMVGIQAICMPDRRWATKRNKEDFIRRFVFPGGMLPSIGSITEAVGRATHLQVLDLEDLTIHYAETLRRWREAFDEEADAVHQLGLDDRFCRLWRFYLAYCEAAFLERHCTVNQFVLVGRDWRPDSIQLRHV